MRLRSVRWFRVAPLAAVLGLLTAGLLATPAQAVEATQATNYFAQFANGDVGWYKVALEKDLSNSKWRAKITVWCEPNTTPGGSKVACDAIDLNSLPDGASVIQGQYWSEGDAAWASMGGPDGPIDYSPPLAGLSVTSGWACGFGPDQYRAAAYFFKAAANNQWSQEYTRVTPTYVGTFCQA